MYLLIWSGEICIHQWGPGFPISAYKHDREGRTGSRVDIMCCVMLKNISCERIGNYRKIDRRAWRGLIKTSSILFLLYDSVKFVTKKQCHYEDIRLSKWWHTAITNSSLTVLHILTNHKKPYMPLKRCHFVEYFLAALMTLHNSIMSLRQYSM